MATIYENLCNKLQRTPTSEEVKAEVKRIISEVSEDMAAKGKLPHQRKRAIHGKSHNSRRNTRRTSKSSI
jgi:hypothetical protein